MNISVILGSVVFVLWSIACNWWYVCEIKGLCTDSPIENEILTDTPDSQVAISNPANEQKTSAVDSVELKQAEVDLPEINIVEDEILFVKNSDQYVQNEDVKSILEQIKTAVEDRTVSISIAGHTCNLGSEQHNTVLAMKRAKKVAGDLATIGIDTSQAVIGGFGEAKPLNSNSNEKERQRNRRVEIKINSE